jgi:hypothetical protein
MNQTFFLKKDNKIINKDDILNNLKNNYSNNQPQNTNNYSTNNNQNQNLSSNNSIRSQNTNNYSTNNNQSQNINSNNSVRSQSINNQSQNMIFNKPQNINPILQAGIYNNNTVQQDEISEYNDEEDDEDDEEVDVDPLVFSDTNPEFVNFKQNVKDWVTLDDDIKTLQEAIKKRKKRITELTPLILDFMKRFNINDLNTQNGQLRYTTSLLAKPVNKNFLLSKLGEFFKDNEKSQAITTYIYDNRIKEEKVKLKRVIERKKINI